MLKFLILKQHRKFGLKSLWCKFDAPPSYSKIIWSRDHIWRIDRTVEQRNGGTKERRNDGISSNVECRNIPSGINKIISDLDFLSARGFPKLQYNSKFPWDDKSLSVSINILVPGYCLSHCLNLPDIICGMQSSWLTMEMKLTQFYHMMWKKNGLLLDINHIQLLRSLTSKGDDTTQHNRVFDISGVILLPSAALCSGQRLWLDFMLL